MKQLRATGCCMVHKSQKQMKNFHTKSWRPKKPYILHRECEQVSRTRRQKDPNLNKDKYNTVLRLPDRTTTAHLLRIPNKPLISYMVTKNNKEDGARTHQIQSQAPSLTPQSETAPPKTCQSHPRWKAAEAVSQLNASNHGGFLPVLLFN